MYKKSVVTRNALNRRVRRAVQTVLRGQSRVPCVSHQQLEVDIDSEDEGDHRVPTIETNSILTPEPSQNSLAHSQNVVEPLYTNLSGIDYDIKDWALINRVSHTQLSDLLKRLRKYEVLSHLPADSRTLLKTPRRTTTIPCPPGEYVHFGFEKAISEIIKVTKKKIEDIVWQINIDGIPLTKSSNMQFWPILAYASGTETNPFPIGIYCGKKKPENIQIFLEPFLTEVKQRNIKVHLFCCDAPARSFIFGVKSHNAFSGCGKCTQKGKTIENTVAFSTTSGELRTNETFRNQTDDDHHNIPAPLLELESLDLVSDCVYEYMHLVCLGVTKKLLLLWIRGNHRIFKLSSGQVTKFSELLLSLSSSICLEFCRKPRPLAEIDRWKATEFRQFLLYTGPVTAKEVLPPDHYQLFMCLSISVSILVNPELYLKFNSYADELLRYFVKVYAKLYGEKCVSYNIHGLLHLAADAKRFGPLDSFSAFKFENELGKLKRLLRSSSNPLQQIHRRLNEQYQLISQKYQSCNNTIQYLQIHEDGPIFEGYTAPQYKKIVFSSFTIICGSCNNSFCILKSGQLVKVLNVCTSVNLREPKLLVVTFNHITEQSLFKFPCDSKLIGVFIVNSSESDPFVIDSKEVVKKCQVFFKQSNKIIVFPLIHTDD